MPNVKLTERDERIIRMIQAYGGVLHKTIIKQVGWPQSKTSDAMDDRLDLLCKSEYLNRLTGDPSLNGAYWLGWRGVEWLAQDLGLQVSTHEERDRDARRQLQKQLVSQGLYWRAEPNPADLGHELLVSNVHFAIAQGIDTQPQLQLADWRHEMTWRTKADRDATHPDAFFVVTDSQNHPGAGAAFLLEVDNTTHPQDRFMREKIHGGLAYLLSDSYKQLAGTTGGRWLEVFKSPDKRRMPELIKRTRGELKEATYVFLFAYYDDVVGQNPITAPIWQRADKDKRQTLLEEV